MLLILMAFLKTIYNAFFLKMALRLLAFKQIHKILGMDMIINRNPRKRQRDYSENDNECK